MLEASTMNSPSPLGKERIGGGGMSTLILVLQRLCNTLFPSKFTSVLSEFVKRFSQDGKSLHEFAII